MRVAIAGAGGRMGRALIDAVLADRELSFVAALDVPGSPIIGKDVSGVKATTDVAEATARCEVLIDFTRPEGTLAHLEACLKQGRAMVIGTTGFSLSQTQTLIGAAKRIPIAMSPNYAVGVNVVFRLAEMAAQALGAGYDVEIIEAHHRHKVDAPSGTALKLGELVAKAREHSLGQVSVFGRKGDTGERDAQTIGFHSIRGGDIVGEHTVLFAGLGERVELTVRSQSRATYAVGALRAAKWLRGRPAGLYDMYDVLGLR